ncbi:MAG: hypothetical protein IJY19_11395 [Ruminococcus sp.]|nr:hypothetical protein [Ruminococcus sp.]
MSDLFKMLHQTEDDDKEENIAIKNINATSAVKSANIFVSNSDNFKQFNRNPYNRNPKNGFSFDTNAKQRVKEEAFNKGDVYDRYTGQKLTLTQKEAENLYGRDNMSAHAAEGDHIVPAKRIYEDYKKSSWHTDEDIRDVTNKAYNLEPISREVNNAKRDSKNREFLRDKEKLKEKGIEISEKDRIKGIIHGDITEARIKAELTIKAVGHITETFHESGKESVSASLPISMSMSGISNIIAYLKGEKTSCEAITDSVVDVGKSAATSYAISGGLTVVSRTLEASDKAFVQSLVKANVPAKIVSTVMMTGKTLKRYAVGEIDTQECIIELGESGITCLTSSAGMAVGTGVGMNIALAIGQTVIPIPVIGAAIGSMIGASVSSFLFKDLTEKLQQKQFDHEERLRIIEERTAAAKQYRNFNQELQSYFDNYFLDCRLCFNTALSSISSGLQSGNINEVIAGANQITRKNGGKILYENFDEFLIFLSNDKTIVF